jgi:ABC-type dipeptide/oligopeptide/nickel transport system permease component
MRFVGRRIAQTIPLLLIVSVLVFALITRHPVDR